MTDISEQLRDCVDRDDLPDWKQVLAAADRIEKLEAALRVAAGYISTKEGHTDQHPQDVYDWIVSVALAEEKKDD